MAFVGSRRALLSNRKWWLAGSSLDLAFAQLAGVPGYNLSAVNGSSAGTATSQLSITRATTGMAQWLDGHWSSFAANTARITDKGLLVEEARTNNVLNATAFANGNWASANASIADNAISAPDNTNTAGQLTADGTANVHSLSQAQTGTAAAYSYSFFFKAGTQRYAQIRFSNGLGSQAAANFDLQTGAAQASNVAPTSFSISAANNGWYRCYITQTLLAASGTIGVYIVSGLSATSAEINSLSGTIYMWGGQLELGSFATSPILTTNAAATRNADVVSVIGAGATSIPVSKSAFFQTFGQEGFSNTPRMLSLNNDKLSFANSGQVAVQDSANNTATGSLGSGASTGLVRSAFAFDNTSMTAVANSGALGTQATSTWATDAAGQTPYIGNRAAGDRAFNGYIQRATFGTAKSIFNAYAVYP